MAKTVPRVRYEIDLEELFGQQIDDPELRDAIGQRVIDRIVERTLSGRSKTGHVFKGYSDSYIKSAIFKAFGKDPSNVNMRLKGDMLGQMDIIEQDSKKIALGWGDTTQNAKAYNHTQGDTLPKRDFFGLPKRDLDKIRKEFAPEIGPKAPGRVAVTDDISFDTREFDLLDFLAELEKEET